MSIFNERPVCGGREDRSDRTAPKEIKSEKLVSFSAHYFLYGEIGRKFDSGYSISAASTADGKKILTEKGHNISCETDDNYLDAVQLLIRKYNLIAVNGVNVHTNGLPAEFQPCYFTAEYESGEKLSFSTDNDPQSAWGRELLKLTREEFTRHGITELNPPAETQRVKRFILNYTKENLCYEFCEIDVPRAGVHKSLMELAEEGYKEGEFDTKIQCKCRDRATGATQTNNRGEQSAQYYEGLSPIICESDLEKFIGLSGAPRSFDFRNAAAYYDFYVEFEYGNSMKGFSDDPDMNKEFAPVADRIAEYIMAWCSPKE